MTIKIELGAFITTNTRLFQQFLAGSRQKFEKSQYVFVSFFQRISLVVIALYS